MRHNIIRITGLRHASCSPRVTFLVRPLKSISLRPVIRQSTFGRILLQITVSTCLTDISSCSKWLSARIFFQTSYAQQVSVSRLKSSTVYLTTFGVRPWYTYRLT